MTETRRKIDSALEGERWRRFGSRQRWPTLPSATGPCQPDLCLEEAVAGAPGRAFDTGNGRDAEADREVEKVHGRIGQLTVERDFLAKRSGR